MMPFPIPPPAEYLYACGPAHCLDLLRRYAALRKAPRLLCSTETAPLLEALAGPQPPDGVILCLPDPAGLELARKICRTYPRVRVACVTKLEYLLEDCPFSYQYIPLPAPLTERTCRQALTWLGYPALAEERRTVHLWLIGKDVEWLEQRFGHQPGVELHHAHYMLDAVGAMDHGAPCDLWLVRTEAGDGPGVQTVQINAASWPMVLVDREPVSSSCLLIDTLIQSIRERNGDEIRTLGEKEH